MELAEEMLTGTDLGLHLVHRLASSRKQSAARVPWHTHDCFELLLAMDGATRYEFSNGETLDFRGGHFTVISPYTTHRGFQDVRRPMAMLGIMFDRGVPNATQGTPFTPDNLNWIFKQFEYAQGRSYLMNMELKSLAKKVSRYMSTTVVKDESVLASLRWSLCGILLETAKVLACVQTAVTQKTVEAAIVVMQASMHDPCSMEHLAQTVGCSRAKLFSDFKESTGMTPNDYWLRLRIDRAQKQLIDSTRSITDIAMDCGFTTSQYFCNVFRKYANMTPNAYRKLFRQHTKFSKPKSALPMPPEMTG